MGNLCAKNVQPVEKDTEEAAEPEEIIGELPVLQKKEDAHTEQLGGRNSRVTLINRPQCIPVAAEEDEKKGMRVKILTTAKQKVTIAYISTNNANKNKCQSIQEKLGALCADSNRICLYEGPIDNTLRITQIDVAISTQKTDPSPNCLVLSKSTSILERLGQRIGVLGIDNIDEEDQWLVEAKAEAAKMKKSNNAPHMIIALTNANIEQAMKLAKICVDGVKVILCRDENSASDEQTQYGTTIINVNPSENVFANFTTTFDNFNQPECKPATFTPI